MVGIKQPACSASAPQAQPVAQLVPLATHIVSSRSVYDAMLPRELALLGGMGACYLFGAYGYAHATPALWPASFGFHELWHLLVAVAWALSYAANCSVLARCDALRPCN